MADVAPIPDDSPQLVPYLAVDGADAAIAFYVAVFGATERLRIPGPGGRIGHAELEIGTALVMLADVSPEVGTRSPRQLGGSPVTLSLHVEDVDAVFERATAAGATVDRPIELQFYGDRAGQFTDPFGHKWFIATHVEDVSSEELQARAASLVQEA